MHTPNPSTPYDICRQLPDKEHLPLNMIIYGADEKTRLAAAVDTFYSIFRSNKPLQEKNERSNPDAAPKTRTVATSTVGICPESFIGDVDAPVDGKSNPSWQPGPLIHACTMAFRLADMCDKYKSPQQAICKDQECNSFLNYCNFNPDRQGLDFRNARKAVFMICNLSETFIFEAFGQFICLLDEDKRLGAEGQMMMQLPNGYLFGIPANLVIIGTMDLNAKPLRSLNMAFRRRFHFHKIKAGKRKITGGDQGIS